MTKLTVPIAAASVEESAEMMRRALAIGADMVEFRTDALAELSVEKVRELVSLANECVGRGNYIVTCRDYHEGGVNQWAWELRRDVLIAAIESGAEYIDVELANFKSTQNQEKIRRALSQRTRGRLILSAHNFTGRFDDIRGLCRRMMTIYPAAIPKLAYKANHINDCFDALDLLSHSSDERIVIAMGSAGVITRILAKKFGAFLTFASIDSDSSTAQGQLTVQRFRELYRFDDIDASTLLYGVIGSPVEHSKSPQMHNRCFAAGCDNKLYLPLLLEGGRLELEAFLDKAIAKNLLGFRGFSVTIPHKLNALHYVRTRRGYIDPLTEKIGAANTLIITSRNQYGAYNTDYGGAMQAIAEGAGMEDNDFKGLSVAVIGAGGVARAIVAGLTFAGADVTVYNRTLGKAQQLARVFDCRAASLDELADINAKLIVNCTSVGMYPNVDETILDEDQITSDMIVFDTVGNPVETKLLRIAAEKGAKTIRGIDMLINQAMGQYKLFTCKDADKQVMQNAVYDNS